MRALVYGAPVIVLLIVLFFAHKALSRYEHRKLIAENNRLRARLESAESAIDSSDDRNAKRIIQHDRLLDRLLVIIAGFEGDNILDLSSQRRNLVTTIEAERPRRSTT